MSELRREFYAEAHTPGASARKIPAIDNARFQTRRMHIAMNLLRTALFCLIVLTLASTAHSQTKNTIAARANSYLSDLVKQDRFSGSVLISRKGRILLSKGYGMANRELDVPNTPKTKFRLASITKAFTAAAIMMLQERGRLSVKDSLCKYIDNCPPSWELVTIEMLLNHTSGITEFGKTAPADDSFKRKPMTTAATLERARTFMPDFTPGSKFAYSSQDYILLGHVIEKITHRTYEEFVRGDVWNGAWMKDTGIDRHGAIIKGRASGYMRSKDGAISNFDHFDVDYLFAAGNAYSTVVDLYQFQQEIFDGQLLKPGSMKRTFTPNLENTGYAWEIFETNGRKRVRIDGRSFGFSNSLLKFPDEDVAVIVLANIDTAGAAKIADDLAGIVFGNR